VKRVRISFTLGEAEFLHRPRNQVRCQSAHHRDRDFAAPQALELLDLGLCACHFLQGLADMADQDLARGRQDQLFRQALEHRRSQLGFQRQDLPADGGRRDIEMAGGLADRSCPGHLVDIS
jgi:hypothetical protein